MKNKKETNVCICVYINQSPNSTRSQKKYVRKLKELLTTKLSETGQG